MADIAVALPRPITLGLAHTILIVDDSAVIRRALRRAFEGAGWNVCGEAADGNEAVEKAEQLQPQVVLLDLAMPGINGLTTARLLKEVLPEARLILLTGHGNLFKSAEAYSAGIDAVFSKSGAVSELVEKAKGFISNRPAIPQPQLKKGTLLAPRF